MYDTAASGSACESGSRRKLTSSKINGANNATTVWPKKNNHPITPPTPNLSSGRTVATSPAIA
jgi:hypothetical protein